MRCTKENEKVKMIEEKILDTTVCTPIKFMFASVWSMQKTNLDPT